MASDNNTPNPGATGRLLGSDNLQRAVDTTERTVYRLEQAIGGLVPHLKSVSQATKGGNKWSPLGAAGGGQGGGAGNNGGGATFGGAPASGSKPPADGPSSHRADGPARIGGAGFGGFGGGGGHRGSGNGFATAAFFGSAAWNIGAQINNNVGQTAQSASVDSRLLATMGRMGGMGQDVDLSRLYRGGGNYAMNSTDFAGAMYGISMGSGHLQGSAGFSRYQSMVEANSIANPTLSMSQSFAATQQFHTAQGFNSLRRVGITTIKSGVEKSPVQIANEVLQQIDPTGRVKSPEQVAYLVGDPMSDLNQTLNNWVANGVISADQLAVVKDNVHMILKARSKGVSAQKLEGLLANRSKSSDARSELKGLGIGDTLMQSEKDLAGEQRQGTINRLEGFEAGLAQSSKELERFHGVLNAITSSIPGLNFVTGGYQGLMKENGKLGAVLGTIGMLIPGGGLDGGLAAGATGGWSAGMAGGGMSGGWSAGGADGGAATSAKSGWSGGTATASGGGSAQTSSRTYPSTGFGGVKPWVARAGWELKGKFGIGVVGGVGSRSNASDHPSGHALDFMTTKGGSLAEYARANWKRLGVTYVIWAQRIWSVARSGEGWRRMEDRGSVTANHFDHVHVSFQYSAPEGGPTVDVGKGSNSGVGGAPSTGATGGGAGGGGVDPSMGSSGSSSVIGSSRSFGGTSEGAVLMAALAGGSGGGASMVSSTPSWDAATGSPGGGSGGGSGSGGGVPKGGGSTSVVGPAGKGGPEFNRHIAMGRLGAYGWDGDKYWKALDALWTKESGWRTDADNPTSSAYGIPQALIDMHSMPKGYYDKKTGSGANTQGHGGDPGVQIDWGLRYIKGRYGDPAKAWEFHKRNNWYDKGAWEIKQDEDARIHKGEMVIPKPEADQIREVLQNGNPYGAKTRRGGGEVVLQFNEGAIKISLGAGVKPSVGRALGKEFVDALTQDNRIKGLQDG